MYEVDTLEVASDRALVSQYTEGLSNAAAPLSETVSTARPESDNASFMSANAETLNQFNQFSNKLASYSASLTGGLTKIAEALDEVDRSLANSFGQGA